MKKYVRVMDGIKSNAGGFEYKLDEENVADNWNPKANTPEEMGGFNFSTEDKILRWLHRGDTLYDVIIPDDAEVLDVENKNCPHGVLRSNKIILRSPRKITEDMIIDLYKKSNLPDKTYYQCLVTLLYRKYINAVKYIIRDRINKNNIKKAIKEFEEYVSNGNKFNYDELWEDAKEIYDILKEINSDLQISICIDKEPYIKKITGDKIINLTGESGSGKSYYSSKYLNNDGYIVIDTDIVFGNMSSNNKESLEIRELFKNKTKDSFITDFDNCYKEILNHFKDSDKTIVIDSAQYRNLKDYSILKGKVIIMRTCIDTCYERCLKRYELRNKDATKEEKEKFAKRKLAMYKWYKSLNDFILKIEEL